MKKIIIAFLINLILYGNSYADSIFSSKKVYNTLSAGIGVVSGLCYKETIYSDWYYSSVPESQRNLEAIGFGFVTGLLFKLIAEKYLRFKTSKEILKHVEVEFSNIDKKLLNLVLNKDISKGLKLYICEVNTNYPLVTTLLRLESLRDTLKNFMNSLIKVKNKSLSQKLNTRLNDIKNKINLIQTRILSILSYLESLSELETQLYFYNQEVNLRKKINYLKLKERDLLYLKYEASKPPLIIYNHY